MKRLNKHWLAEQAKPLSLTQSETSATDSIDGDIKLTLGRLSNVADRVIVSDITVSAIGVPAVRVIITGLRSTLRIENEKESVEEDGEARLHNIHWPKLIVV